MSKADDPRRGRKGISESRRNVLKGAAGMAAAVAGAGAGVTAGTAAAGDSSKKDDLVLVNGKIHTMDDRKRVVSSVAIRNGRFVKVGSAGSDSAKKVVNLKGRTVVPGLLESHSHFVSLANRPGYHVAALELASNLAEVLEILAERRSRGDVPVDKFITSMGGWHTRQWAELRLPTRVELDSAVPDRPVYLHQGGSGPASTNTLGMIFFRNVSSPLAGPVEVGDDGSIASGVQARAALYHLRVRQSFEDKRRSALDAMAHSARVGITAILDQVLPPSPGPINPGQALSGLDHYRMYDAWLSLHREGKAFVRLQTNFLHNQGNIPELGGLENQLPELRERLKNQFPFFGDDMMRTGAIGEWGAPIGAGEVWFEAQRLVAAARWRNENSPQNLNALIQVIEAYEAMEAEFGIKELRWGVQHVNQATPELLERLKALNCGVSQSGHRWLQGLPANAPVGSPFRMVVDSGIPAGMHEDGVHIAPHNPWFALHYATTGLNVFGEPINGDQQITRQEALHCYTRGNSWYLNRENHLGSIEVGKLGDLVVLDKDYFSVSDAQMRAIRPILTVIDGKVVHDSGALKADKRDDDDDDDD